MHSFEMAAELNILHNLGINLYDSISASISEVVANSWDADAKNVWIEYNYADLNEIVITDDGVGMNEEDINKKYLAVGHRKRQYGDMTGSGRKIMGRKGIGKLSLFSIANNIKVISRKNDEEPLGFEMKRSEIDELIEKEERVYHPHEISVNKIEHNGITLNSGTQIVLTNLTRNVRSDTFTSLKTKIARRFNILNDSFQVWVNGELVTLKDRNYFSKVKYIWYYGEESKKYADLCVNKNESFLRLNNEISISDKKFKFTGWIGTVDKSGDLNEDDGNLNKIVIMSRGKVGQEDILQDFNEGGLYTKYLIGEIDADFFEDIGEDMATSSRQEYMKDDERYKILKERIKVELKEIQNKWTDLRNEEGEKTAVELYPSVNTWLNSLKGDDRFHAKKLLGKTNQILDDDPKSKKEVIKYSILAFEKLKQQRLLTRLENLEPGDLKVFSSILTGLDDIEATLYYQIIKDRIKVIETLKEHVNSNDLEKVVQKLLFEHLWLLDPSWDRVDGVTKAMEVTGQDLMRNFKAVDAKLTDQEKLARLDIKYRNSAGKHIVIELKRAERKIDKDELRSQISKYSDVMDKVLHKEPYEIVCVLGSEIGDPYEQEKFAESIKIFHARVVYYKNLLTQSYSAYEEYFARHIELNNIMPIFKELSEEQ